MNKQMVFQKLDEENIDPEGKNIIVNMLNEMPDELGEDEVNRLAVVMEELAFTEQAIANLHLEEVKAYERAQDDIDNILDESLERVEEDLDDNINFLDSLKPATQALN